MTSQRKVYVVGAGGFGRETVQIIQAMNEQGGEQLELVGFYDDAPSDVNVERCKALGAPVLGPIPDAPPEEGAGLIIAVGNPKVRRKIHERVADAGWTFPSLIHPSAQFGPNTHVGEGAVICAGVQMTTNITLGRFVHVNLQVTVGHDSVLDDFVSINPAAGISGEVHVGSEVLVGVGGIVLEGRSVGRGSTVGAAALVVKDVPEDVVVMGVPAR